MRLPANLIGLAAFVTAAFLSVLAAVWAVSVVESRTTDSVKRALDAGGLTWAKVDTDGLLVRLSGTAPSEALHFRALSVAGRIVDDQRVVDEIQVPDPTAIAAPDFSVEILRNDDGISVIGLIPAETAREPLVASLTKLAGEGRVTDLMESASHPVKEGWNEALAFGLEALKVLPRSKVSISAERVAVTAITDSAAEKARTESLLARKAPKDIQLELNISAPRPVITPFTLRFLVDANGARFDACSADTERARDLILAAAAKAGGEGKSTCTIGMGVPTPEWSTAAVMAIEAMAELGAGSVTFSDADISLIAADTVSQADFDKVVGEMESNLPEVFSLHAVLTPKAEGSTGGLPQFTATLSTEGRVQLRGRLTDDRSRDAVESFARARFGNDAVYAGTRLDPELPKGWPVRALAALEALGELASGTAIVEPDLVRIEGITGSTSASDTISRILAARLGETAQFEINVRYDPKLDPLLGLPTAEECVAEINAFLNTAKISFEPGSAKITADGASTLDKIATRMKDCSDFPMEVAGHTDSQGREEMNLALSQERAEAIITALMERRVLTGNLKAVGYGETRPIADNDTEEGREANRRIEFSLLTEEGKAAAETTDSVAPDGAGDVEATGAAEDETAATAAGNEETGDEEPVAVVVQEAGEDTPTPRPRPSDLVPADAGDGGDITDEGSGDGDPNAPPEGEEGSGD
ncbi:OmpA family protein [Ostreiculturibacter nitratireducens]|uniref:OmpA family protein n=1 Tax=Ostreiculturibacter nitratireducens TaxID=3075226 RepID=UPI0031B60063